jgi:hypothetical protein
MEIEAALARGVRVIPILAQGTVVLGRQDLPESLAGLARRHALLIRHESTRYNAGHLVAAIERILVPAPGTAVPAPKVSGLLEMSLARWLSRALALLETTRTAGTRPAGRW